MIAEHGMVTPEAVHLDLPEATVGSRGAAVVVDWTLQALIAAVVGIGASFALDAALPSWVPTTVALIAVFLVLLGYPIAFETVTRGRTPGKRLLGLRVVTVEGGPVGVRHAAIRAAVGLIDFFGTSGVGAVLSSLLSRRNQRLGDFAAGTVVVRERVRGNAAAVTFAVPDQARVVADAIDVSGLTAKDYAAIRAFLLRAAGLATQRREQIAEQLLTAIGHRLGPVPADGLRASIVLEAVAARYQQRAQRRTPTERWSTQDN